MLKVRQILFLWALFCCQAVSHDHVMLRNNSPDEQKILVLFQSRILLKSNESLVAPHGFSFIIDGKERRPSINPNFPDFTEFQRKNFNVDIECEIIIPSKTEKKITPPYSLIRKVSISNSTHDPISFDWEELYYTDMKTKDDWLGIRKESNLSTASANIIKQFDFSRSHNVLDPAYEKTKEPHLRNPASLIRKVYKKTDEDALRGINYLEKSSLAILKAASGISLSSTSTSSEPTIPKRTHRMWITDMHTPTEPPLEQLEYYISSVARLNLEEGWSHKFWCWDKSRLPRTCKILENCGQNIQIAEFSHPDELKKIIAPHFVFAAIDHGLFTLAGNILRNNILFYEGGFYTDIGAEFKQNPSRLFLHSDIIAHHRIGRVDRRAWWIDHDFMAAKAGNFIIRDFLNRINTLHELAGNTEIVTFFKEPRLEHSWTNARLLTEIFNLFSEAYGIKALILPNDETIIAAHHQTSWYGGDGKSCKDIDKTTLNWFKVTPDYKDLHDSLMVDKFNLELYKKYFAPGLTNPGELTHHFLSQNSGIKVFEASATQSLPLTVTLTSWPGKIRNAHIAIASLLSQTFKPNKVILWLAEDEFPDKKIPKTISQLASKGLEVRWCENIRSAKKLIPSMRDSVLRETLLVVADDDIMYRPNWLESLMIAHHEHPKSIIAHRPRVMKFGDDQKPMGYNSWPLYKKANHAEGDILFPTSGAGVLFPPHSLHSEALNTDMFMAFCPTGDDIFWFAMCVLQGTEIRAPSDAQTNIIDINDEEAKKVSLWDSTNRLGANDVMIKAIFAAYDIYSRLKAHLKPMAKNADSATESNDH